MNVGGRPAASGDMYAVTNRIRVKTGHGVDIEKTVGKRGGVEKEPGFKSFELWRQEVEEDHEVFLVVTRWETKEDFKNWTQSASFREAHSGGPPDFILGGELANYEVKLSSENY